MKDFAKSIKTGNSNKEEIIKKKKQEGATLKVDNGQKLEFSDGSTFVKTSFSEDYREAKNYTGNAKVGNYDAFLSNAKAFLRDWEVGVDAFEKDGDKGRIEMIMRSAEAKYKELEKYKDQCYDAYKESSDMLQGYKELYKKAQRAASKL